MKCIKDKNDKITRVKDQEAGKKVASGSHSYTTKGAWKRFRQKEVKNIKQP